MRPACGSLAFTLTVQKIGKVLASDRGFLPSRVNLLNVGSIALFWSGLLPFRAACSSMGQLTAKKLAREIGPDSEFDEIAADE